MNCPKCNKPMLVESKGNGTKRVQCAPCGIDEVQNQSGQKLLTETQPSAPSIAPRRLLTEG